MKYNRNSELGLFILSLIIMFAACKEKSKTEHIQFYTSEGNIKFELYSNKAPLTVSNFLAYVDNKLYDGAMFYRTVKTDNQPNNDVKIEVIQGGLGFNETDEELPPIYHESTFETGILHLDGTISMARADTGTVSSEFFICIGDQPQLDFGGSRNPDGQGFAAFGRLYEGIEIVKTIQYFPDYNQILIQPVIIDSIRRIE